MTGLSMVDVTCTSAPGLLFGVNHGVAVVDKGENIHSYFITMCRFMRLFG